MKKGDIVDYHSIIGGPVTRAGLTVIHDPYMLGETEVTFISGITGCVATAALTPTPPEKAIIDDPLEWQGKIDNAGAPINTHGCSRFWNTVAEKGLLCIDCDGNPDMTRIVLKLEPGLGLELSSESFVRYRFVEVKDE